MRLHRMVLVTLASLLAATAARAAVLGTAYEGTGNTGAKIQFDLSFDPTLPLARRNATSTSKGSISKGGKVLGTLNGHLNGYTLALNVSWIAPHPPSLFKDMVVVLEPRIGTGNGPIAGHTELPAGPKTRTFKDEEFKIRNLRPVTYDKLAR